MSKEYKQVLIETYRNSGEPSANGIRARPIAGQGFDTSMKVECSTRMRDSHPVGTVFRIRAVVTDCEGTPFLYSYFGWPYEVVQSKI